MPVFEHACRNSDCPEFEHVVEHYFSRSSAPPPVCDVCGQQQHRLMSECHYLWGKLVGEYGSPKYENYRNELEGHTVWRNKSTRRPDGLPEPCVIRTRSEQIAYCREEGLRDPFDVPADAKISKDGKTLSTNNLSWV